MKPIKKPEERLKELAKEDKKDLIALITYSLVASILFLAVPLATQALVNTIAAGIFIQPLIVMSVMLFGGLLFLAILQYLEIALVEVIQQRIFARISFSVIEKIPKVNLEALKSSFPPEVINRFFDVLTIQKTWSKLLISGLNSILQIFFGLLLISFYSPVLLAFDLFIIFAMFLIFFILGKGGFITSLKESTEKYKVVAWLEELGICLKTFKLSPGYSFLLKRTDELVSNYIQGRKEHFNIIARQAVASYLFYAIATTGVFAIGGYLVINRQLTLGQLVASELIIVTILSGFQKIVQDLDRFYDLLTALEKLSYLTDLQEERKDGIKLENTNEGLNISFNCIKYSYNEKINILKDLSFEIKSGEKSAFVGKSGSGKTTIAKILCGFIEPTYGSVQINSHDIRDLNLKSLRSYISLVSDENEIFEGTIEENITLNSSNISKSDLTWALDVSTLSSDLRLLSLGLKAKIPTGGINISKGLIQKILISRALITKPSLLILNNCFSGIDQKSKIDIVKEVVSPSYKWTALFNTNDSDILEHMDCVYLLSEGKLSEKIEGKNIENKSSQLLDELFPYRKKVTK